MDKADKSGYTELLYGYSAWNYSVCESERTLVSL